MSKINLLYLIDKLQTAGTQKHLIDLVENINEDTFNPHVICIENKGEWYNRLQDSNVSIDCMKLNKINSLKALWVVIKLVVFIYKHNIHILHCYLPMANLIGSFLKLFKPWLKVITTRRDLGISRTKKMFLFDQWVTNRLTDLVIVNSMAIKNQVVKTEKIKFKKIKMIYNGITTVETMTDKLTIRQRIRDKYNVKENEFLVGLIGDMNTDVKGHRVLFKSLLGLSAPIKVFIVGEGDLRMTYMKEVEKMGLSDKVLFLGVVNDIKNIIKSLDLIVVPSHSEGLPNIVLESMMYECPIIASNVGGIPELIEDNVTGLLVPVNDWMELKNKMKFLSNNEIIREQLKQNAKSFVQTKMSLRVMVESIENEYISLLPKVKKELSFATN